MAAEAKYRKQCCVRYFSGRITNEKARERSEDAEKQSAFDTLCVFPYENDACQCSLAELEDRENEKGKPIYSRKHLKEKLLARLFHHNRFCGNGMLFALYQKISKLLLRLQKSLKM